MFTLINNELRKIVKRMKSLVVLILFICLVGLMCYGSYENDKQMKKYNSPEFQIQQTEDSVRWMKEESKRTDTPKEQIKANEQRIIEMEKQIADMKNGINKPYDYKEDINNRLKGTNEQLANAGTSKEQKEFLSLEKERLEKQLSLGISPKEEYELNSYSYLKNLFMILGSIFLAVGIAIFSSDIVSGEYTPATMKFLLIQPVSRGKVLFSKYITLIISVLTSILSIEFISFVIMGLIYGFGSSNNPVITGAKYMFDMSKIENGVHPMKIVSGSQYISTTGMVTLKLILFQILFMIAVTTFVFMVSTIVKSSMVAMALSTITIVVFSVIQAIPGTKKIAPYLFTMYGNTSELLSGNMAMYSNSPKLTPMLGVTVLIVWSIASYLVAHFVFIKKDILI